MIAVGFGLVWLTWGTGLWGYCLIRGYDISPKQIFSPIGFYAGPWPPPPADDSQIIPSGQPPVAAGSHAGQVPSKTSSPLNPRKNHTGL